MPDIGLYNWKGLSQCNPQVRWIDGVKIDYVGRVENYLEDVQAIFQKLGLPIPLQENKENTTAYDSYESSYCTESKQIVEHYYAEDFQTFGYVVREFSS